MRVEEHLDPDIDFAGLKLWIHSWEFPEIEEYWDANWLCCTAVCKADGATVRASGAFLHLPELLGWLDQCERVYETLSGDAVLEPIEPTLKVLVRAKIGGHMDVQIHLTPDHLNQQHRFSFKTDQTHVGALVRQLRSVRSRFPVRGVSSTRESH